MGVRGGAELVGVISNTLSNGDPKGNWLLGLIPN